MGLSPAGNSEGSVSPPTSPLAMKSQHRSVYQANPPLAALSEEDEGPAITAAWQPTKRVQISPPRSPRVPRSHSQKLPSEIAAMKIDTSFITVQRPRYCYLSSKARMKIAPPTCKQDHFEQGPSSDREGPRSPEGMYRETSSTSSSNSADEHSPRSPFGKYLAQPLFTTKNKGEPETAPGIKEDVDFQEMSMTVDVNMKP